MATHSERLHFSTRGDGDVIDLTAGVTDVLRSAAIEQGAVTVFVGGATAAITTMEFERGGVADLLAALERLIPREGDYEHNRLNQDTNSHAHIRAAVVGPTVAVPVVDGRLATGNWQQIVLMDFDDRPRERTVIVQVTS